MEKRKQKIFKSTYLSEIRDAIRRGDSVADYYEKSFSAPQGSEWESTIAVVPDKLNLKIAKKNSEQADCDLENSINIYEAFPEMDELQASDPRLWAHLTHADLRKYVLARWPLKQTPEEIKKDAAKASAVSFVLEHWFSSGADRSLRRNAIARLWWAARLTVAPWDRDPEFFGGLKGKEDRYALTRVVFATQDVFQQVLERSIGRDNKLLIAVLDCIRDRMNAGSLPIREQIRAVMKELNLMYSVRNLAVLDWPGLKAVVEELFVEAGSIILRDRKSVKKKKRAR